MPVVLFEDSFVAQLEPVTLGKPAFAIHCGGYSLAELAIGLGQPLVASVRPHLREMTSLDFPDVRLGLAPASEPTLLVNARLVPSVEVVRRLGKLLTAGRPGIVRQGDVVAAAMLGANQACQLKDPGAASLAAQALALGLDPLDVELPLFEYPHDIIRHHQAILAGNLQHRLAAGLYREVAEGLFLAHGASCGQYVVTDTRRGPILLEAGATVGPYCYLSGPAHLGANARVIEHSAIKDGVALGHTTKIGGEVEASIIEPYTNKQHHGFLGHSYLGSWINLGAGTCNSDLKNTYGKVNMEYRGRKVATDLQFIGAVIGDYSKTAINTGIFTGKVVGVCSMMYGFVTTNVPSFVNYARLFGQVTEAPVEVMVATQRRMFSRRGVTQRPCDIQLLHDMYELTAHERAVLGESLSLEPLSL